MLTKQISLPRHHSPLQYTVKATHFSREEVYGYLTASLDRRAEATNEVSVFPANDSEDSKSNPSCYRAAGLFLWAVEKGPNHFHCHLYLALPSDQRHRALGTLWEELMLFLPMCHVRNRKQWRFISSIPVSALGLNGYYWTGKQLIRIICVQLAALENRDLRSKRPQISP